MGMRDIIGKSTEVSGQRNPFLGADDGSLDGDHIGVLGGVKEIVSRAGKELTVIDIILVKSRNEKMQSIIDSFFDKRAAYTIMAGVSDAGRAQIRGYICTLSGKPNGKVDQTIVNKFYDGEYEGTEVHVRVDTVSQVGDPSKKFTKVFFNPMTTGVKEALGATEYANEDIII